MARANDEAAALIQELADLLSITGGDAFKIRAYEKAARAIATASSASRAVCKRPSAFSEASSSACTPRDTRFTPAAR